MPDKKDLIEIPEEPGKQIPLLERWENEGGENGIGIGKEKISDEQMEILRTKYGDVVDQPLDEEPITQKEFLKILKGKK